MKVADQLPLPRPQLEIIGDLDTQNLNRDQVLVRVSFDWLIYLRPAGIAAGITLPRGTDLLIVVPEDFGSWIDDRYMEKAEADAAARRAETASVLAGLTATMAEAGLEPAYEPDGEASDIPF